MRTFADILLRAADLVEPEGAWIQGELGLTEDGEVVTADEIDRAVCFCMSGAVWKAIDLPYAAAYKIVLDGIFPVLNVAARQANGVGPWNDAPGRTQAEVVAALRKAAGHPRALAGVIE